MALKSNELNKCATVTAEILLAYKNYVDFNYPKDPNIYIIRASPKNAALLLEYVTNSVKFSKDSIEWPFKIVEDISMGATEVIFGPEQVNIAWRDDYGM